MSKELSVLSTEYVILLDEQNVAGQIKPYMEIFLEIPFQHFMLLCSVIGILSFSLNLLVFLYDCKSRELTRSFILAYVLMDWSIIVSCFIPLIILWYTNFSHSFNQVVFVVFLLAINSGFGLYIYPSFFLALDRILVVMFPLTFHTYVAKLRVLCQYVIRQHLN